MKSAYELAMEKLEKEKGPGRKLSDEEREEIAEIGRRYDAKAAETRLSHEARLAAAPREERAAIRDAMNDELKSLEEKRQRDKDRIWEPSQ